MAVVKPRALTVQLRYNESGFENEPREEVGKDKRMCQW